CWRCLLTSFCCLALYALLREDGINRTPLAGIALEHEHSPVGPRDKCTATGLLQREHVPALQARAFLQPVRPPITGVEHSARLPVVHHTCINGVRIFLVGEDRGHVTMRVAVVRSREALRPIVTGHHAARSEEHTSE